MGNHWDLGLFGNRHVCLHHLGPVPRLLRCIKDERLIDSEHSPGSLREPMPTSLWPAHGLVKLGTTFGLIAAAVCLSLTLVFQVEQKLT
jgi:hypothetical protein